MNVKTAIDGTSIPIYHDVEKISHEPEKIKPIGIKNGEKVIETYKKDIEKVNSKTESIINEINDNISTIQSKQDETTIYDKIISMVLDIKEDLIEIQSKIKQSTVDKIKMMLIQIKLSYDFNKNIDENIKIKLQIVDNLIDYYNSNNQTFDGFELYKIKLSNIDVLNFLNNNFKF